jgi:hypothetical protein
MRWTSCVECDPELGPAEYWMRAAIVRQSRAQQIAWVEAEWPDMSVDWRLCAEDVCGGCVTKDVIMLVDHRVRSWGGAFRHGPEYTVRGLPRRELVTGSGGATCADIAKRRIVGWDGMSVFPCTEDDA